MKPPPKRPRANHGQAVPAVAKPASLDARTAQRFSWLSAVERLELVALETRSIAFAVQNCADDDRVRGESTGVRPSDARTLHRMASWAEYDAALARWRQKDAHVKAEAIQLKIGEGGTIPHAVAKVLKTRPVSPNDNPKMGYVRPEAGPPHAPALPTDTAFVTWDSWLPAFLASRKQAIARGWEP